MPMKLEIKRKLCARSDRVKCVDFHPDETWMLASLFNGQVHVWDFEKQQLIKTFEVCEQPVRAARFVARKNWIVAGSDDMKVRVYNYHTLEKIHQFEPHMDFIRSIAVHPTQPFILTSSDDMTIKLWDWDKKWICSQVFEGHTHYVMQVIINPKDNNQFASASLDRTIKVWQLGSSTSNFTLEGHEKGVNCVDYYHGGDRPYLISGADDRTAKIWDYQNKSCVQTLDGHVSNISGVMFHPNLPIIITASEDCTVRVWHSSTYRLENTLNYGMERVWSLACQGSSNSMAIGYDEGAVILKLGREEPATSMDSSGKILWARHSEIQQANIKSISDLSLVKDGEPLGLAVKDMGSCEIYPQTIQHNPNGRFVVVCGEGEYIVYTAMALRNKTFGSALEFVWGADSSMYATREGTTSVKLFKSFKETKSFKPDFGAESIYGGVLLGVRSVSGLDFYDWETTELIRRIEITPKKIAWNETGDHVCIVTEESFFVLRYSASVVETARSTQEGVSEDGYEEAFEVFSEINEAVKTCAWVGDCFIYINAANRLNYFVGGEIVTIAHLDRVQYLLGYIPKENRLYVVDKELNVMSYALTLSVLEYQTAVMRKDFDTADKILPQVPRDQRARVAHFLEKQGFKQQAMAVTTDQDHKFELALQLEDLKTAYCIAEELESTQKWRQLSELALRHCEFGLAKECMIKAQDFPGLLLLATASGSTDIKDLAELSNQAGHNNISFLSYLLLGDLNSCLEVLISSDRLPEAAFFARAYIPSEITRVVQLWRQKSDSGELLADPEQYDNLFEGYADSLKIEQFLSEERLKLKPASHFQKYVPNHDRCPLDEVKDAEVGGHFTYVPSSSNKVAEDTDKHVTLKSLIDDLPSPHKKDDVDMDELERELERFDVGEHEDVQLDDSDDILG